MPFVQSGNARIHWQSEGKGTPVLLIMGHLYSSEMWYPLIPELTKQHRVITFDNRGTGQSDTTSGVTVEQMTADALAVLDAAGERRAHVYGVSMGGGIAGEFGMAYPERCLSVTLGCTMLKQTHEGHGKQRAPWVYHLPRWLVRLMLRRMAKPEAYGSAAPREAALHDIAMLAKDRFTMKGVREQNLAMTKYVTTPERARRQLTMPVLVLHGDEDALVDVKYGRELHDIILHTDLVIYPGAGHNFLVASGGKSNRDFIDFIEAVDAKKSVSA
jgi:pimeloyl-ACP methyl ester carboxylesterase